MKHSENKDYEYEQLELQVQQLDTDTYVFKSHNLIESGYNFTLNEQRLTYLASKKLKPRYIKSNLRPSEMRSYLANETFKDLKIYVNEFKDAFNLNSNNLYKVLQDTAFSLKRKIIQYMQDDGSFVEKDWVITCKYNEEGKYVELTFHPDLILDLLVLKGKFGKMEYNAVKHFRSTYAFRIYELLQNYAYRGMRTFELQDLRYKLGIYDDNKYSAYYEFKRNVLMPSIKSINEYTNLQIEFHEIRYGRKVGAIEFDITQKATIKIKDTKFEDIVDLSQVRKMHEITGVDLTAGQVAKLTNTAIESIRKYKIDMSFYEYIEYEVCRVQEYSQISTVQNYYGCLLTALREYWQENVIIQKTNTFNNFESRDYDYDGLEDALLYGTDKPLSEFIK